MKKYTDFTFRGKRLGVNFIETINVVDGVECDVYEFIGDREKDLGIIRIAKGARTPKQLVLKGDRTIEGYISGKGKLYITGKDFIHEYQTVEGEDLEVTVHVGEKMQWVSDLESDLVVYEVCFPPYVDGRYQDL